VACRDRVDQGWQLRGGGGALDHAYHQRCSAIEGGSQALIARSARGQDGVGGGKAGCGPLLSAAGCCPRFRSVAGVGWSWNHASQQKQNAQLTRAWWRRIAVSERTWKSGALISSLTCL
jgi:hypothetical protein